MKITNLILVLITCLLTGELYAFTLNNSVGAAFEQDVIKVNVSSTPCSNMGMTNDELLSLAGDAMDKYWNTVATSRLQIEQGDLVATSADFQTGLICQTGTNCVPNTDLIVGSDILISCNTNATNFSNNLGVLGVTVPNNISGEVINGALVLLNDIASNQFQSKSKEEQMAILAHEIGHAIGLGHSPVEDSLMYYLSFSTRMGLGWDDVDGVTYLYPAQQPFGGCGSVSFDKPDEVKNYMITLLLGFFLVAGIFRPSKKRS